jgi:zinc protease
VATVEDFTLDNGMRFIVAPDASSPGVTVGMWVRAGVCEEPEDRRGIAHFFEHMMFRGSASVGPQEHARRIQRFGGRCNAQTSFDATVYFETVPPHALEEVFTLEADRFLRLRIDPERAEVERNVILEEYHAHLNQPIQKAFREMLKEISGGHPYGINPLGREEDLKNVTVEDLQRYGSARYRPRTVFCTVVGDVTSERVRELAQTHFGPWRADGEAPATTAGTFEARVGTLHMRVPVQVPFFARVHRLRPAGDEDLHTLQLLERLISAGESSPLRNELVRRRRLCVHAGHMNILLARGGVLIFFGAFLPPGRHSVRRAVAKEICDRLAREGPAPDEFRRHLKTRRKERAYHAYDTERRMWGLGGAQFRSGDYRLYLTELEQLAAVTPEKVRELAERLFAPDNTLELDVKPERRMWWMVPVGLLMKLWPR